MEVALKQTWAGQEMQGALLQDERQRMNLIRMCSVPAETRQHASILAFIIIQ